MKKLGFLFLFSLITLALSAQSSLFGTVKDATGVPLAFANVSYEKDSVMAGVTTDLDGDYHVELEPGIYTVIFSMTGYHSLQFNQVIVKNNAATKLDAVLEEMTALTEVVVVSKRYSAPVIKEYDAQTFSDELVEESVVEEEIMVAPPKVSTPPPPPPPAPPIVRKISATSKVPLGGKKRAAVRVADAAIETAMTKSKRAVSKAIDRKKAGTLTAGEVNDFSKWKLWGDKSQRNLLAFRTQWWIYPSKRFSVMVQNQDGFAVVDQEVTLLNSQQEKVWVARTDNLGRAELWANMFDEKHWGDGHFTILTKVNGQSFTLQDAKLFNDGVNQLTISKSCDVSDVVDVAFVVDATGSMSDEISYLKAELNDVIGRVQEDHETLKIRLGSVFYRDEGEAYLTRKSGFSTDVSKTVEFIRNQSAAGGGDTPEAVEAALLEAVNGLKWSAHARTKLLFLVLDAPPHTHADVLKKLNNIIITAAQKGIRIIPITGSGIDKNTEYLMRCLALSTNGTYVFLTDHSGVGGSHIKPTTDSYNVETLNDLLIRLFDQFTTVVSCEKKVADKDLERVVKMNGLVKMADSNKKFSCKFYPNPTYGRLNIKIKGDVKELFLTDLSGRILERFNVEGRRKFKVDLSGYPAGTYQISYWGENKRPVSGQVVLIRD